MAATVEATDAAAAAEEEAELPPAPWVAVPPLGPSRSWRAGTRNLVCVSCMGWVGVR